MTYFDQHRFRIRCEWGVAGIGHLAPAEVVIVVDVLSFTTAVDVASGRGVAVFPYRWKDDGAVAYAAERHAELAGSRRRFDGKYSLSPASLLDAPPGMRLVLPSPNGSTIAFEAMSGGAAVAAGSLRNAAAVAAWAQHSGKSILIVPAGERWPDGSLRPAVEDLLGAGAIISHLSGVRSPEAEVAAAAFEVAKGRLFEQVSACSSGRELVELGFERDIELAAALDASSIVPVLKKDVFVPTFGRRVEGRPYIVRPCAYALVRRGARELAVVRTKAGWFLPGGGIETGENAAQAAEREAREECGLTLKMRTPQVAAAEIVYSSGENACFEKQSTFFEADILGWGSATERDHELVWVSMDQALTTLSHASHRWAVARLTEIQQA